MDTAMPLLLPALGVLAVLLVPAIVTVVIYNRLVALRVETANAWADIDVQLKRRHDLIPNLVAIVKGYTEHERDTLQAVTAARSAAVDARAAGPSQRAGAENMLTGALGRLFALSEGYPQLRAAEPFQQLHRSIEDVEKDLQQSRRYYNATVRELNTRVRQFPSNLVARATGIGEREFFEVDVAAERAAPGVRLG